MIHLLRIIGVAFNFIIPYFLFIRVNQALDLIYSGYLKNLFRQCGNRVIFRRGSRIIGDSKAIIIGQNVSFGKNTILEAHISYQSQTFNPIISIGDSCIFGDYTHITCISSIKIGKNILTGRRVLITDNSHGDYNSIHRDTFFPPISRELFSKGSVTIEDDVWLGDNVIILPGTTIGKGSVIGANAVVTKDIPPYTIAGGNPAKIIKTYYKI